MSGCEVATVTAWSTTVNSSYGGVAPSGVSISDSAQHSRLASIGGSGAFDVIRLSSTSLRPSWRMVR